MGDITKYKDKIDPGKEYEIIGQDILNVINTIDSLNKAKKMETKTDKMQEQISSYLAECTKHELSLTSSKEAAAMIRSTNELESIGDSSLNLFLELEKFKDEFDLNDEINSSETSHV